MTKKYLEVLEKVKRTIKAELAELDLMGFEQGDKYNYLEQLLNELTDVEKPLKALEIIKEKYVNVDLLWDVCCLEEYNFEIMCSYQILTEEYFNLLREVLK